MANYKVTIGYPPIVIPLAQVTAYVDKNTAKAAYEYARNLALDIFGSLETVRFTVEEQKV